MVSLIEWELHSKDNLISVLITYTAKFTKHRQSVYNEHGNTVLHGLSIHFIFMYKTAGHVDKRMIEY